MLFRSVLPSTYTLFHICRWTGGSNARILNGYTTNWLSGFWNNNTAVAYHNGWIGNSGGGAPVSYGTNFFISTDQNTLYRSNGVARSSGNQGTPSYDRLCINTGVNVELSNFQIMEVIVYNTSLSTSQMTQVEAYLSARYGITLGV